MTNKVKLAVYDTDNNFLGYKSDTFWTLDKTFGKQHTYMDEERLLDNYMFALNERQETGTLLDILLTHNKKQLQNIIDKKGCIIKSLDYDTEEVKRIFNVYQNSNNEFVYEEANSNV